MKILIAMITIDRGLVGRQNYLERTLQSMEKSGLWDSKTPFSLHLYDGGSSNMAFINSYWMDKVVFHPSQVRIKPRFNPGRAMLDGGVLALQHDYDYVLFVEDDIDVCKDWLDGSAEWLEKYNTEEYRVVTFYTPYKEVEWCSRRGEKYWKYPVQSYYGSQCLAIRPRDAASCGEYTLSSTDGSQGFDMVVKAWHKLNYPNLGFLQATVPSFVQHTGEDSVLNPGRFHACGTFRGEQWTAMEAL